MRVAQPTLVYDPGDGLRLRRRAQGVQCDGDGGVESEALWSALGVVGETGQQEPFERLEARLGPLLCAEPLAQFFDDTPLPGV